MQENNQRRNPFIFAPALTFPIILLLGIGGFVFANPIENNAVYIVSVLLGLFVFGVPTILFFRMRGGKWFASCTMPVGARGWALAVSAALLLMVQSAFCRSLVVGDFFDYHIYTLYGIPFRIDMDSFGSFMGAFFPLAVLPAFLEGIFFRGILMHEYRYGGVVLSVFMSSLLYAMTGASFASFPLYFLNGILLSMTAFLTGNVFCSVLADLIYLLFAMLGEKYVLFLAEEEETCIILLFFLVWLWITVAIFFFDTAENVLRKRGEKEHRKPFCLSVKNCAAVLYDIVAVPMLGADVLCFAVFAVLHLLI